MFFPGAAVYMDKLVGGEEVAGAVSIDLPPDENVRRAAGAKGVKPSEIAVVVLDRERNQAIIEGVREAGAKVNLITDGDVAPAIAAARQGTGVDLMMGIGGTPEGVIAAAAGAWAGSSRGGSGRATTASGRRSWTPASTPSRVLTTDDLVAGDNVFVSATGSPTGRSSEACASRAAGRRPESIVMRSRSGTVRRIEAQHALDKLERFSGRQYR